MSAKRLMNHRLDAMGGNDGPFWRPSNVLSWHQFLGDDNQSPPRFRLFFIFPAGAMYPAIPVCVGNRNVDHRYIRRDPTEENELFPREGTLSPAEIVWRLGLEALHHLRGQEGFDRYEGDSQSSGKISKSKGEATRVDVDDRAVVSSAIDAADGAEAVQRPASHNQFPYQAGADEQIRFHAHHSLRQSKVLLLLTNDFVSE